MNHKIQKHSRFVFFFFMLVVFPAMTDTTSLVEKELKIPEDQKITDKGRWTFGLYTDSKTLDYSSKIDSSSIEAQTLGMGVKVGILFPKLRTGTWHLGFHGGRSEGEFNYRSGDATLELKGWEIGGQLTWMPAQLSRLNLKFETSFSSIEGRDFTDHTTGTRGLLLDSELESFSYSLEASYQFLQYQTKSKKSHEIRGHLGLHEKKWDMNLGWFTNSSEELDLDQNFSSGLSYKLSSNDERISVKSYGGFLSGGYELGLDVSLVF